MSLRADHSSLRVLDNWVSAVQIATNQRRSAACLAADIHQRFVKQPNVIARNLYGAAFGPSRIAARFNRTGVDDGGRSRGVVATVHDDGAAGAVGVMCR